MPVSWLGGQLPIGLSAKQGVRMYYWYLNWVYTPANDTLYYVYYWFLT